MKFSQTIFAFILFAATAGLGATPDNPLFRDQLVVAHRGASAYLPEHTLPAYAMAHAYGADFIELDLALSKDGHFIVIHDLRLDSTTNVAEVFPGRAREDGSFYVIDFTVEEIKSLSAFERKNMKTGAAAFPNRFPMAINSGITIPTLPEVVNFVRGLNHTRGHKANLYIELKNPQWHEEQGFGPSGKLHDKRMEELFLDQLRKLEIKPEDNFVVIQCFQDGALRRFKNELQSTFPLVQLIGDNMNTYGWMITEAGLRDISTYASGIGPSMFLLVDKETGQAVNDGFLMKQAKALGLLVHPWTVRADELPVWADSVDSLLAKLWVEVGVDGVFIDQPDLALRYRSENLKVVNDQFAPDL